MTDPKPTLADLVQKYMREYRNPDLPPFKVWPTRYAMDAWYHTPESAMFGCYVFYSSTGEVLYIGKASLKATMGSRLAAHDRKIPRAQWREKAHFVQFVSVSEPFEAPSLEEFLILQLRPEGNRIGGESIVGA